MEIKEIDHIDIAVKDLEDSIKVFEKMGFELLTSTAHIGGAAELKLPGAHQPIFELHGTRPGIPDGTPGEIGIMHIAFTVDDAQKTLDELKAKGVGIYQDTPHFQPQTGRTMALTADLGRFYLHFVEEKRKPFISH